MWGWVFDIFLLYKRFHHYSGYKKSSSFQFHVTIKFSLQISKHIKSFFLEIFLTFINYLLNFLNLNNTDLAKKVLLLFPRKHLDLQGVMLYSDLLYIHSPNTDSGDNPHQKFYLKLVFLLFSRIILNCAAFYLDVVIIMINRVSCDNILAHNAAIFSKFLASNYYFQLFIKFLYFTTRRCSCYNKIGH